MNQTLVNNPLKSHKTLREIHLRAEKYYLKKENLHLSQNYFCLIFFFVNFGRCFLSNIFFSSISVVFGKTHKKLIRTTDPNFTQKKCPLQKDTRDVLQVLYTEGPRLTHILGLEKTVLHEIRVSGTVEGPLLT